MIIIWYGTSQAFSMVPEIYQYSKKLAIVNIIINISIS